MDSAVGIQTLLRSFAVFDILLLTMQGKSVQPSRIRIPSIDVSWSLTTSELKKGTKRRRKTFPVSCNYHRSG